VPADAKIERILKLRGLTLLVFNSLLALRMRIGRAISVCCGTSVRNSHIADVLFRNAPNLSNRVRTV
jgi:hypothetical protein